MRLKLQKSMVEAGRPIVFLPQVHAEELRVRVGERAEVRLRGKRIIALVNIVKGNLRRGEISLSSEVMNYLDAKIGEHVDVKLFLTPNSTRVIAKKLNGKTLSRDEIYEVINDIVANALTEAEIAYFVAGVYDHGMSLQETIWLTEAVCRTGRVLKWHTKEIVDKHSIGGIAGNRTTPIVISICAAAGLTLPKTSSRAITSAAGTADVVETVTRVDFSADDLQRIVKQTGACMAWGGSLGLAPADDKLIRIERLLNVDPQSQLIASILAKKLAVGSKHVLLDIPYGPQAKVTLAEGEKLKQIFLKVAAAFKLNLHILLTKATQPIGNGVGPILEMIDVLKVLDRTSDAPKDLETKAIMLAGTLFEMTGVSSKGRGSEKALEILNSKKARSKFEEIIVAQGKKKTPLTPAKHTIEIKSGKAGKIKEIDNKKVNMLCKILGCPQDKASGIYLYNHVGARLAKGQQLLTMHAESTAKLAQAQEYYKTNDIISIR